MPGGTTRRREEALNLDDSDAMESFLADVERRAYRLARAAMGDPDEALDIVQDAMIKLVRNYSDRPSAEWRPLFYRILKNRIVDYQRRNTVRNRVIPWWGTPRDADDDVDPVASAPDVSSVEPDQQVALDATLEALQSAVAGLPARQQQAFLLRTIEGFDVAATAKIMGCSPGSVKTHLSRAVRRLRESLGDHWS